MFVIDAIPLSAGLPSGTLSYRSKRRLSPGTLVYVPLRSKSVPALVVNISTVMEAKAQLKAAGFALRGGTLKTAGVLPESVVSAAREIATYHAATMGGVLSSLLKEVIPAVLPKKFLDGAGYEKCFFEDTYEKRVSAYRKLVEQMRAKKKTVLLVAPTLIEAERLFEHFKSANAALITGGAKGKKREDALTGAANAPVVVATPAFAWVPIEQLGAIVIERASASGYVLPKRPYIDVRVALRALAEHRALTLAYGDLPLPVELRPKPMAPLSVSFSSSVTLIDPKEEQKETGFAAIPKKMLGAVQAAHADGTRSVILSVRKGYSPAVVCRDCGNLVRDERGAPLSLVIGTRRILRSADGTTKLDADAVCSVCGSWNLLPIGIGVERVVEELQKAVPDATIVRFDTDSIRTSAQAKAAMRRFSEPDAIGVGTEMMLPFLDEAHPVAVAGIASADSLLALPFWRARERLVRAGLTLRERAKHLYISTRLPDNIAMHTIAESKKTDFFREESEIRNALSYPPFGHLVVFHAEGTKTRLDEAVVRIEKALHPFRGVRLADRKSRSHARLSYVVKVKASAWPDQKLADAISQLPPWITLHLDPESLW